MSGGKHGPFFPSPVAPASATVTLPVNSSVLNDEELKDLPSSEAEFERRAAKLSHAQVVALALAVFERYRVFEGKPIAREVIVGCLRI